MAIRNSFNKPLIAGTLAGVFLFFLSTQVFCAESTRFESLPTLTVDHSEAVVIRDSGNGGTFCPTLKNLFSAYQQVQFFSMPITEMVPVFENRFSTIDHNVFYVFVSSLAP